MNFKVYTTETLIVYYSIDISIDEIDNDIKVIKILIQSLGLIINYFSP